MSAITKTQQKAISPHVSPNESIKSARAGDDRMFVVTDRRVLTMNETEEQGRTIRNVDSTFFSENVVGVSIERRGSKLYDEEGLGKTIMAFAVGAVFAVAANFLGMQVAVIPVLVITIVATGVLGYYAFRTPNGAIQVTLEMIDEDATRVFWLPEDESDVAAEISKAVGEAIS
jgi:VIT1/CCC1 family predicted Fe2+/Mn2+ transporter